MPPFGKSLALFPKLHRRERKEMIAQRPGRGDILHDDFDHLLAVLEERAANAFLIRVLSIGLQNSSYQLRSFERSIPVIRFASSATAEVLLPALDTACHSPMRSAPDRSIHQSRQGKAPRSIQGASLPLRHGSSRSCEGITPTLQSDRPFPHKRDGIVC
jgi:hypothetical protein